MLTPPFIDEPSRRMPRSYQERTKGYSRGGIGGTKGRASTLGGVDPPAFGCHRLTPPFIDGPSRRIPRSYHDRTNGYLRAGGGRSRRCTTTGGSGPFDFGCQRFVPASIGYSLTNKPFTKFFTLSRLRSRISRNSCRRT